MASPSQPQSSTSKIAQLSSIISSNTATLDSYHTADNLPSPSFSPSTSPQTPLPPEIETARLAIEHATLELHDLVRGPLSIVRDRPEHFASRAFIAHYDIPSLVPTTGSTTYAALATQTGVSEAALTSLLRLAIAHRLFLEPSPGQIAHSAASKLLLDDASHRTIFRSANLNMFPLTTAILPALQRDPRADDETRCAASLVSGTWGEKGFYDGLLAQDAVKAEDFNGAMRWFARNLGLSMRHVLSAFDWAALPEGSLCVDVGGGEGAAAMEVARAHPGLRWEVQDLPTAMADLEPVPPALKERLIFRAHDFLTEQPVHSPSGPSVFLLRWIMHNHYASTCHRILRALTPSLQANPDCKIVIMDAVLPPVGIMPNIAERGIRGMDVMMLELGNGKERSEAEWRELVEGANEGAEGGRLVVESVKAIDRSALGAVVVGWKSQR